MNKNVLGIIGLAFLVVAITAIQGKQTVNSEYEQNFKVGSLVCEYVRRAGETDWELIEPCTHNLFTTVGKNWTRDVIGNWAGGGQAMKFIATGNGSATQCTNAATLAGETPSGAWSGTYRTGSYAVNPAYNGNWTVSAVYTANEAINGLNSTALFNASSSGTMFACNNFTTVNLIANDQLNITWFLWVTEG